jgi:hypothetical protein
MLDQRPFTSGQRVVRHIVLALVATAVAPPLLAWGLNAQRESQTRRVLQGSLLSHGGSLSALASSGPVHVSCGSGRIPDIDRQTASDRGLIQAWTIHEAWLEALGQPLSNQPELTEDAWGRCILSRSGGAAATVMLSAGANGLIETPLSESVPAGDDILLLVD